MRKGGCDSRGARPPYPAHASQSSGPSPPAGHYERIIGACVVHVEKLMQVLVRESMTACSLFLHLVPDFPKHRLSKLPFDPVSPQVVGPIGNITVLAHLQFVFTQQYVAAYASVVIFPDWVRAGTCECVK